MLCIIVFITQYQYKNFSKDLKEKERFYFFYHSNSPCFLRFYSWSTLMTTSLVEAPGEDI